MSEKLLTRIRKLNWVLSESTTGYIAFHELCNIMNELLDSNVYVLNRKGKVLAATYEAGEEAPLILDETIGKVVLPKQYNEKFLALEETQANLIYDSIKEFFGEDYSLAGKYHVIVPIIIGCNRVATMLAARPDRAYDDEDIAICEYGATVIGMEMMRAENDETAEENRKQQVVQSALSTLSGSELKAMKYVFKELQGTDGILVASKIAESAGITRSIIVTGLKKLESAGVIESKSAGMKGTKVRICNDMLMEELENM